MIKEGLAMSQPTTLEYFQPYSTHNQKHHEVSNRSQHYHPAAEPCYWGWSSDPTLCGIAECVTAAASNEFLSARSVPATPWCENYQLPLEDSSPVYSERRDDYLSWISTPCSERPCVVFRSHTSTKNHQRNETASSGQPQQPFQCNHCQKNFPKKADRDRHEFSVHREKMDTPRGLIDCPEKGCPRRDMKGFTRKDNLLDHRRRVHNRNIPKRNHALGGRSVRR